MVPAQSRGAGRHRGRGRPVRRGHLRSPAQSRPCPDRGRPPGVRAGRRSLSRPGHGRRIWPDAAPRCPICPWRARWSRVADKVGSDVVAAGSVYFAIDACLRLARLRDRLEQTSPRNQWERSALAGLYDDLVAQHRRLTIEAFASGRGCARIRRGRRKRGGSGRLPGSMRRSPALPAGSACSPSWNASPAPTWRCSRWRCARSAACATARSAVPHDRLGKARAEWSGVARHGYRAPGGRTPPEICWRRLRFSLSGRPAEPDSERVQCPSAINEGVMAG